MTPSLQWYSYSLFLVNMINLHVKYVYCYWISGLAWYIFHKNTKQYIFLWQVKICLHNLSNLSYHWVIDVSEVSEIDKSVLD